MRPGAAGAGIATAGRAQQLAAMAARAWVFGGMGSWNDLGFELRAVEAEYDEVSRNLYAAVLLALLASANDGPGVGS